MYLLLQYVHSQVMGEYFMHTGLLPNAWAMFDVCCLFSTVYLLLALTRNIKWICTVSMFLCVLLSIANISYSRYFELYFSFLLITQSDNLPLTEFLKYVINSFKLSDLIIVAISFVYICILCKFKNTNLRTSKKDIGYIFLPLILGCVCYIAGAFHLFTNPHIPSKTEMVDYPFVPNTAKKMAEKNLVDYKVGMVRGELLYSLFKLLENNELSFEDINEIVTYSETLQQYRGDVDDIIGMDTAKNIVFIICESYLSATSMKSVEGKQITPFLNKLRNDSTTIYNGNISSNVGLGESFDGQFMYMTGISCLPDELSLLYVENSEFPTWCRNLKEKGYSTLMTIPTHSNVWSQRQMCSCYGIDSLYSTDVAEGRMGIFYQDNRLFDYAMKNEENVKSPYVHFILTFSTHSPYDQIKKGCDTCSCLPKKFPHEYSKEYANYLKECHYMDHQIEKYCLNLKRKGLYNNTIIVIVADHGLRDEYLKGCSTQSGDNKLPLYICNTGRKWEEKYSDIQLNQIDLFPTFLDLFGLKQEWRGLGCSLFAKKRFNSVNDKTIELSNKIIRGGYFSKKKVVN